MAVPPYSHFGKKGKKMTGRFVRTASKERHCTSSESMNIQVSGITWMIGSRNIKEAIRLKVNDQCSIIKKILPNSLIAYSLTALIIN